MHARIAAGQIVEVGIPTRLPVHFNGRWWDCRDATIRAAYIAAADWRPVTDAPAPADTGTTTHDYSIALVGGVPTVTWTARPWTVEELAARAEQAAADAKAAEDRAILDAIAHTSASAHADGETWTAPTGAHDAYALGATVTHNGKDWESLTPANVWAPGTTGWREVVAEGPAAWVQPLGAHDAYPLGAKVTHKGQVWTSTAAANIWEPGVYGWA